MKLELERKFWIQKSEKSYKKFITFFYYKESEFIGKCRKNHDSKVVVFK